MTTHLSEDDRWRILRSYFRKYGVTRHHFEGYEKFMFESLRQIILENSTQTWRSKSARQVHELHFTGTHILKPNIRESNGIVHDITPYEARMRSLHYSCPVMVDLKHVVRQYGTEKLSGDDFEETVHTMLSVPLCKIPCLVGSRLCALRGKEVQNECPSDTGGYFIINGLEKCLIPQLKLRVNKAFVFAGTKSSKYRFTCEIRSCSHTKYRSTSTLKIVATNRLYKQGAPRISVILPFLSRGSQPLEISLPDMFLALGVEREDALGVVFPGDGFAPLSAEARRIIEVQFEEESQPKNTRDKILQWLGSTGTREPTAAKQKQYIGHILRSETLPHVGIDSLPETMRKKAYNLGQYLCRLASVFCGDAPADDRDSYEHKRLDGPGSLLSVLFRQLYRNMLKSIRSSVARALENKKRVSITHYINSSKLTNSLAFHFATGSWSLKSKTVSTGVVQVLSRMSYLSTVSHLQRLGTPLNKETKSTKPRQLNLADWGINCACESPEGGSCGLVKNLAYLCHISTGCDLELVEGDVARLPGVLPFTEDAVRGNRGCVPLYINGKISGVVKKRSVDAVERRLRRLKRSLDLPFDATIVRRLGGIHVSVDQGRCVRPLFVVSECARVPGILDKYKRYPSVNVWQELLVEGCIEFVDKEQELGFLTVALDPDMVRRNRGRVRYTHMEIHPTAIFGITALLQPFPEHNQGPRNVYNAAMSKQGISLPMYSFRHRVDTHLFTLDYPSKPLVRTQGNSIGSHDALPNGMNCVVAVGTWGGHNQEDSVLVNQAALDRGLGAVTYYRTFRDDCSSTADEIFEKPPSFSQNLIDSGDYSKLEADGFPRVGAVVGPDDVIIGKSSIVSELEDDGKTHRLVKRCCSTVLREKDGRGVVDQVIVTTNSHGKSAVKIKIRYARRPQMGDKLASRHSQKGTIGMIYPASDFPVCERTGMVPDLIINPCCLPSRMTVAHLLETCFSKVCAIRGEFGDGTAFQKGTSVESVTSSLEQLGFQRHGEETMRSGLTGERMRGTFFVGPIHYMRLRHQVQDKVHSRSRGIKSLLCRQPMEGRARGGGLRMGEMERDCLINHGCAEVVRDRLFMQSDYYEAPVCAHCGYLAVPKSSAKFGRSLYGERDRCLRCGPKADVRMLPLPYATKLCIQELEALHIGMRIRMK